MSTPAPDGLSRFWRYVFAAILAVGIPLTVLRYTHGLGAVTNLSDNYPWGIWKSLNVIAGVGIGGAGFSIMAAVYIFHLERLRPIVRPAIVMAFLAYASVAFALAIDIGRTWAIWHPIVFWNGASVLFDVSWCLMLYTGVLLLEVSGMLFERLGWPRMLQIQHAITLPVVLVGVVLSTLHQSSLGSLFLIVPGKLHALWYTPILPVLFYISAICVGFAVLILLARVTANAFGARIDPPVLSEIGRILVVGLGVYTITRSVDLLHRGALGLAFSGTYESIMFLVEFVLGAVLPLVLLLRPAVRTNARMLHVPAVMVVLGFVANRLNVGITGFEAAQGGHYVPAWTEVVIGLMVPALACAAYVWIAQYLRVFQPAPAAHAADPVVRGAAPAA